MSANSARYVVTWNPIWRRYVLKGWRPARWICYPRTAIRFVNELNRLNGVQP